MQEFTHTHTQTYTGFRRACVCLYGRSLWFLFVVRNTRMRVGERVDSGLLYCGGSSTILNRFNRFERGEGVMKKSSREICNEKHEEITRAVFSIKIEKQNNYRLIHAETIWVTSFVMILFSRRQQILYRTAYGINNRHVWSLNSKGVLCSNVHRKTDRSYAAHKNNRSSHFLHAGLVRRRGPSVVWNYYRRIRALRRKHYYFFDWISINSYQFVN